MLKIESHDSIKKAVEHEVIETIEKQGCNLNIVNNYGENLLHVSATNGCYEIAKKILGCKGSCPVIDRKNKFGWTPLMQAIRNGDIGTVKLLLENNSNVNESTYLGMSVLGLATAISKEMFDTVYNAYPNALANAATDDISPLCVAAMKNDKELFFKLLELGMPLSSANEFTHVMMKNSTVPEIASLAKEDLIIKDYWDDTSDNIQVMSEPENIDDIVNENGSNRDAMEDCPKQTLQNGKGKKRRPAKLHLLSVPAEYERQDVLSPALTYNCDEIFVSSPNTYLTKIDPTKKVNAFFKDQDETARETAEDNMEKYPAIGENQLEILLVTPQRAQPVQKKVQKQRQKESTEGDIVSSLNDPNDQSINLGYTPEFSPLRSPHVPADINDENVFGENTPTPPRCRTPPKGILLNVQQTKMVVLLRYFELSQHIPMFLEQEVDIDLFLMLTNNDLIEIGIEQEEERIALMKAIKKYGRELNNNN